MKIAFLSAQNISSIFREDILDENLYLGWGEVYKQILDIKMVKISYNNPRDTRTAK